MPSPAPRPAPASTYERLPSDGKPLPMSHPDVLAVTATLAGLTPAALEGCRVLEVGCAVGGNLLPMAQSMPGATFVGIDISPRQITEARRVATGAGLTNVRFETLDLAHLPPDFGQFDYVIAHGVYAWVAPAVRDRLLDLFATHLAPAGVAYLNYHVYPGWHARQMVRDMIVTQIRATPDLKSALDAARRFLGELSNAVAGQGQSAYPEQVRQEARFLATVSDEYLLHDYLEASPQAVYFQQFVEQLTARGLDYVADVRPSPARLKVTDDLRTAHREWGPAEWLKVEQHADFISGNSARRSLVCRAGTMPPSRLPPPDAVERLSARSAALPQGTITDLRKPDPLPLRLRDGATIHIAEPFAKLTLVAIARAWPRPVSFDALLATLRNDFQLGSGFAADGSNERAALRQTLAAAHTTTLIDLHASDASCPSFTPTPSERPRATPLARFQAREFKSATNLLHHGVASLNTVDRLILAHANGERTRASLAAVLKAATARHLLPDPAAQPNEAFNAGLVAPPEQSVDASVQKLAANAFFMD